jgi:hypothetical protein
MIRQGEQASIQKASEADSNIDLQASTPSRPLYTTSLYYIAEKDHKF